MLPQSAVCVEAIFRPLVPAGCCVGELSHQDRVLVVVPVSPACFNHNLMIIKTYLTLIKASTMAQGSSDMKYIMIEIQFLSECPLKRTKFDFKTIM